MPQRYAIIGNPVAHSKSPQIHAAFSAQTGIPLSYELLLAPLDGFRATVETFRTQGGSGANVTLPFKLEAFALAGRASERAHQAGAVNVLKFSAAEVFGDNTDGVGLVTDIRENLGHAISGRRVLVIGAGGAARGVIGPILQAGAEIVAIANRTFSRAEQLALAFGNAGNTAALAPTTRPPFQFDIVINATAASLEDSLPPVPRGAFARGALAYEMMYGMGLTPFLALAQQAGAEIADGLGMLVEQAAEAFFVWHGVRPATAPVLESLRQSISPP